VNVQRDVYGKLMPADFRGVLHLPYPVEFIRQDPPTYTDDPTIWPVHRSRSLVRDTELTDFHEQRMGIVR